MKAKKIIIGLALLTALTLAFSAPGQNALAAKDPVKLALISYRTGVAKDWGDSSLAGFQFAIKQLNAKGGILGGRKVVGKDFDEGYSVEVAVSNTKKALAWGAKGIVGYQDATTAVPGILV